jgi:DNA polymerase III subunit delta
MSKTLDYRDFSNHIDRQAPKPLYLIVGEETFMVDEALAKLREKALDGGLSDFNLNVFYASDCKIEDVRDAVETLPMMAARRVVILKQCQDLSAAELESLTPLVENPVDTTVFIVEGSKADMRKKFFKLLESKGVSAKFQRPFENQVTPWIHYIAKKHGKSLNTDAADMIREWVGTNLHEINNELAKASQFVGSKEEIAVEDLKQVLSRTRIETVFELVNSMGRGDCASSFTHLANLLDNGQSEIGVLAMTIRHFRILLLCQEAVKEGLSQSQIAGRVGVHGFFIREYIEQAKTQDSRHLLRIYDVLLDTDRALKSNPLSSHLWLENLVLQACRTSAGSASATM